MCLVQEPHRFESGLRRDTSRGVQTSSREKGLWIKEQHSAVSEVALTSSSGH